MVRGEATIEIARPVETVFGFVVTDFFDNYPRWSPEVVTLEPLNSPRIELGTTARQVRVDQGRRSDTLFRVVSLEPARHVAFRGQGSPAFTIRFDFTELGDATELTFRFELTELKLYMRPFERLIRHAVQDGSERTVRNIKTLVESEC